MQYISRILIIAAMVLVAQTADAQPPARKGDNKKSNKAETTAVVELTERAKSQYPVSQTPQEVDWKREIYRSLNLENEKNAPLYYPVEQIGNNCNLFTFLFNNILKGSITAYKYNLDGIEQFTEENIVTPVDLLDNYRIYYEEKDGELTVGKSDIPSAEVLSYYIKESHYYDQRTGSYGKRVTAICPVLHRAGEFGSEVTKYPMFWLKYDDIAPLLTQQYVMTSSLNNVMSTTLDDFFKKGYYDGEIYKTVNMRNLAIAQYCKDSVAVKQEQEKIEQQLKDFRTNLWSTKSVAELKQDSINAAVAAANDTISIAANDKPVKKEKINRSSTKSNEKRAAVKKEKTSPSKSKSRSSSSNAKQLSVRRERR
ncbi:MAG: gliding motility protein GldN [Bacteroidaceae bacterium]|nr:gliding motility protein GldN [Bacteroidaceae bacterium]